jgi:predicted tellurium resistance membrane protein TerC
MIAIWGDPNTWLSLATLVVLEIVLGIDNIIFLSLVSGKLPAPQQQPARRLGLSMALLLRVALLLSITWVLTLGEPIAIVYGFALSWRDIVLGSGGLFLIYKGTQEIHNEVEPEPVKAGTVAASFMAAVFQIALLDLVFSLDSIITAVGVADHVEVMIAAVAISIIVMMVAAATVSAFIEHHPTVKMLGLSFLLLIGVALLADGAHFHIPREYLYFAVAFSMAVESLNLLRRKRRKQHLMKNAVRQKKP